MLVAQDYLPFLKRTTVNYKRVLKKHKNRRLQKDLHFIQTRRSTWEIKESSTSHAEKAIKLTAIEPEWRTNVRKEKYQKAV